MRVRTRLRTHARARIGGRRRAQRPAPDRTSAERVPLALARRRADKAAHTLTKKVTAAVFHAPMSALNADAE
jgi:hypothetical protein